MLLILIGLERFIPRIPAPLVAVAVGIAASGLLALPTLGVEAVGHIPQGLPSLTMPNLELAQQLWPGALGIALISFTESIASARAFAERFEPHPEPNRELLATGIGNVLGGLFSAMPAGGGTSQTAVNRRVGARTQAAPLVTAAVAVATLLFLAPLMELMPKATLAAVVIVYSIGLIQPAEFLAILRIRRMEFLWAVAACGGVVLLGTMKGIVVAIVLSLLGLLYQASRPRLYMLGRKPEPATSSVPLGCSSRRRELPWTPDGAPRGPYLLRQCPEHRRAAVGTLRSTHTPRVVVFDFSAVPDIEYSALKMLIEGEERLQEHGIELWLVALNPEVLRMVQLSSLGEKLGRERLIFNLQTAVERYLP